MHEHQAHLHLHFEPIGDDRRCAIGEAFRAVAALQQEASSRRSVCELAFERQHFPCGDERQQCLQLSQGAIERRRVAISRLLQRRLRLPGSGRPILGHARRREIAFHSSTPILKCCRSVDQNKVVTVREVKMSLRRFAVTQELRNRPAERRRVRQAQAVPLLDDMKRWFEATLATLSAKSDTSKAIRYAMNRWPELVYYCSDGRVEIDNLIAERALRGVAIGRRNYLFIGADSGGERAAAMYSLIGTASLNGLDPEADLAYVLERIADHLINRIEELLPWSVAPSLPSTAHVEPIR